MMPIDMTSALMPMVYGMYALLAVSGAVVFGSPALRALRGWMRTLAETRPTIARPALGHSR